MNDSKKNLIRLFVSKPMTILMVGSIFAQAIQFLTIPLISRIFSSASFGRFALFQSILSIVSIGAILKLDQAIIAENDDDTANELFASVVKISVLEFVVLFPTYIFLFILNWGPQTTILAIISGIAYCVGQAFIQFNLRSKKVFKAAIFRVSQAVLVSLMPLLFVHSQDGLIYGATLGYLLFFALSFSSFNNSVLKNGVHWRELFRIVRSNRLYIKYALIPSILDCACMYLIVYFVTKSWGESSAGYWNMSKQLLSAPSAILGVVISQLIIREGSSIRQSVDYAGIIFWKYLRFLAGFATIFSVVLIAFKNELVTHFLGPKWHGTIEIIGLLVFPFMFTFLASPLSTFLTVRNKVYLNGLWQVLHFLLIFILILFKYESFRRFLFFYSSIEIVLTILYVFMIWIETKKV